MDVEGEEITLSPEELLVEPGQREGYALEREGRLSVALRTELDAGLVDEGLVRELVHRVQNLRREKGFEIEESISVGLSGNPRVSSLLEGRWGDYFKAEVLAKELSLDAGAPGGGSERVTVDGEALWVRNGAAHLDRVEARRNGYDVGVTGIDDSGEGGFACLAERAGRRSYESRPSPTR